jgi:hypothetical protein
VFLPNSSKKSLHLGVNLRLAETRIKQRADALEERSHVLPIKVRRGLLPRVVVVLWRSHGSVRSDS